MRTSDYSPLIREYINILNKGRQGSNGRHSLYRERFSRLSFIPDDYLEGSKSSTSIETVVLR